MRLVSAFVAFVGSVATSDVDSRVGILSKFFIGNNLLLKVLRTFSLALNNSSKLFQKIIFIINFKLFLFSFSKAFILAAKLLWSSSASFNALHVYFFKKIGKEYLLKL